jgi:hypothetical protein
VAYDSEQFARPRAASGALYFDGAGRVMLVKPTYKPLWDIPGGLHAALDARAAGRATYLERGAVVPRGG